MRALLGAGMPSRRSLIQGFGALATATKLKAQPRPETIRIGYVPVIGARALFVLDGAGWAREAGLVIRKTEVDPGPTAIQALASGTLDALAIGVAPVAVARAKGLEVKV